jgi:PKHD-type hydroxylase
MFIPFENDTNSSSIVTANNIFTPNECNEIIKYANNKKKSIALVKKDNKDTLDNKVRKNKIVWLSDTVDQELHFLYEKMLNVIFNVNNNNYNFDLYGLTEDFQFTEYSELNDHYDFHVDVGLNMPVRKLSMVVQLSNPLDYSGANLEIYTSNDPFIACKDQGSITICPSYLLHKVTPLLSGTRYSLVAWVGGPKFK